MRREGGRGEEEGREKENVEVGRSDTRPPIRQAGY